MEKAELKPVEWGCFNGYQLDLTSGCSTGCKYCSLAEGYVGQPKDISELLKQTPENKVYLSPHSDAFDPVAVPLTRQVLQSWLPKGVNFAFITKQEVPSDIISLMGEYKNQVSIEYSLARLDEPLSSYIEPGAPAPQTRLKTIDNLINAGVSVWTRLNPIFPSLDDTPEKFELILDAYKNVGVDQIRMGYAVVRDSDHPLLRKQRDALLKHPEFARAWNLMIETIKIERGRGNTLPLIERKKSYSLVNKLSKERGMNLAICADLDLDISSSDGVSVCGEKKVGTHNVGLTIKGQPL